MPGNVSGTPLTMLVFNEDADSKSYENIKIYSADINRNEVVCKTEGRHDPCICPRIVPVVEAMATIVIVDHVKRYW